MSLRYDVNTANKSVRYATLIQYAVISRKTLRFQSAFFPFSSIMPSLLDAYVQRRRSPQNGIDEGRVSRNVRMRLLGGLPARSRSDSGRGRGGDASELRPLRLCPNGSIPSSRQVHRH